MQDWAFNNLVPLQELQVVSVLKQVKQGPMHQPQYLKEPEV